MNCKAKVKFYLRTNSPSKNGDFAVMLRVGFGGVWLSFGSTGLFANATNWEGGNFKGRSKVAREGREVLGLIVTNVEILFREYYNSVEEIDLLEFRDLWKQSIRAEKKVIKSRMTMRKCLEKYVDYTKKRAEAKIIRANTYKNALTLSRSFEKEFKFIDCDIRKITQRELEDYQMQLLIAGFKETTVNCKLTHIKAVFSFAMDNDLILKNPATNIAFIKEPKRVKRLTEEELNRFLSYPLYDSKLIEVRDIFEFMCVTGLSYADTFKLRKQDIIHTAKGDFIEKERHKSSVPYCIPIIDRAWEIIDKYARNRDDSTPIFDMINNGEFNYRLNEVAERAKLGRRITSHSGRYTFASLAINNGIPLETMRRIMGHTNIEMTESYGRLENERVTTDLYDLENKLKERIRTWRQD